MLGNTNPMNKDLRKALRTMIKDSKLKVQFPIEQMKIQEDLLVTKLASYITRREHNAFNAGFKKGEAKNVSKM